MLGTLLSAYPPRSIGLGGQSKQSVQGPNQNTPDCRHCTTLNAPLPIRTRFNRFLSKTLPLKTSLRFVSGKMRSLKFMIIIN